jgi:hypothetical protein
MGIFAKKRAVPKLDTPQQRRREQERQFKPLAQEIGWIAFEWNRLEEALAELFADAISDHQRALDFRLLRQSQRNVSRLWRCSLLLRQRARQPSVLRRSRAAVAKARETARLRPPAVGPFPWHPGSIPVSVKETPLICRFDNSPP